MNLEIISREPVKQKWSPPLLFIHGSCHAAWCWNEYFLPYFAENGFSAHALSLRGHGASDGAEKLKWVSVSDYLDDIFQVVSTLSETPVLIGHSLGGLLVQKYLEKHAAPAGILLASSPSEGMLWSGIKVQIKNPWLFTKVFFKQDFSLLYNTPESAGKFLFSADADKEKVALYSSRIGKESFRGAMEMTYNLPKPGKIKPPLLVLGAENDAILSPSKVEKTARAYNADCKIFPDMAHDMMLERGWQKVADFMIDWLEKKLQRKFND
jgi:pimeloyl-ACP methyl ester carboxylesterase